MPVAFVNRNPAFRKADILTHQSLSFTNPEPRVYEHCDERPPLDRACSLNRFNFVGGEPTLPSRRLPFPARSEEHTSELQSRSDLVCRLLLEKKKNTTQATITYSCRRPR